ncbi:uncharacterized protein LOC134706910 [Mytilus trossulus]|uniref:uncharacterized protein LOC134706910 n=1 Tax=Mytilus trossulus TaxID=6551 RepID=UPI003004A59F
MLQFTLGCLGVCIILILSSSNVLAKSCTKKSACSCLTESGHLIDLNQLAKKDGTPAYADIIDPNGAADAYAWNPCNAFTLNDCNNVAVCHEIISGPIFQYIPIGTQDSAEFSYNGDQLQIAYSDTQNAEQKAVINLVCDKSVHGDFTSLGQDIPPTGTFLFQLKSKYVCDSSGLSVGSILCIGFVSLLFLYILIGILVQIFIRKESGKRVIPNHDFWVAVPVYIKDGTRFVIGRGKVRSYDAI